MDAAIARANRLEAALNLDRAILVVAITWYLVLLALFGDLTGAWTAWKPTEQQAAWVQAVGSISAILAAATVALWQTWVTERERFRVEITKEIRDTNASMALCHAVANLALQFKKQHTAPMLEAFDREKRALLEYQAKRRRGEIPGDSPYEFVTDLRALPSFNPVAKELRTYILERLTIIGRPLSLAVVVAEESDAVSEAISARNARILEFEKDGGNANPLLPNAYFGLGQPSGRTDTRYPDLLNATAFHLDCIIWFTIKLSEDLKTHGNRLVDRYKERLGQKSVPTVNRLDFSDARAGGLVPSDDGFASWTSAFVDAPASPR